MGSLAAVVHRINSYSSIPGWLRSLCYTVAFNSQVPFAGLAGVRIRELNNERAVVTLGNKLRIRNHIGSPHAAAMALTAETATGSLFAMNIGSGSLPLCKHMNVSFTRRAKGSIKAVASLSTDQIQVMGSMEKGEVIVPVLVTDESGEEPLRAEFCWAWVPRTRTKSGGAGSGGN